MDLINITGPDGAAQNIGGTTGRIRISAISAMTLIQKKKEMSDSPAPTTADELVKITANHTWAVGKGAVEIYITRDEGKLDFEMNQARDTTGVMTKFMGKTPGAVAITHGALAVAANTKGIAWIELADGQWAQLGSARFPAEIKYKWGSGKNVGEYRGFEISIEAFESTFQVYTGTFQMAS